MKKFLNSRMQDELELGRPAENVREKLFRFGVGYLQITTLIGSVAGVVFGAHGKDSGFYPWIRILIAPYLFFMVYCSNYAVA
ncbi:MAG: hypothetical protein ACI9R3_004129 [Verrucomicrobiales bacterium]|jgi:hypothetical protein